MDALELVKRHWADLGVEIKVNHIIGRTFTIGADGCVEPPEAPGIGLAIDEKIFAEFPAIDGPGYVVKF